MEGRVDAVEAQHDLAPLPMFGDYEGAPVAARRIFVRHSGRIGRKWIRNVRVMWPVQVVPFHLPVGGNGQIQPMCVVVAFVVEISGSQLGPLRIVKLPY